MKKSQIVKRGRPKWQVDYGVRNGRRRRESFDTESEADAAIKKAAKNAEQIGRAWTKLPAGQSADVVEVLEEMRLHGVDLRTVWEQWLKNRTAPPVSVPTLGQAIDSVVQAKRFAERRERYVAELERYLRQFARGREATPINRITRQDLEDWFNGRKEAAVTRASSRWRLATLFTHAAHQKWIAENPAKLLEQVSVKRTRPAVLSVDEARIAVGWIASKQPRKLAWFVLAVFAGIRPEELERITWDAVNLDRARVIIDEAASKTHRRRITTLQPNAVQWLRLAKEQCSVVALPLSSVRRLHRRIRKLLKWKRWPQDVLRHTAASYLLAFWNDSSRVSLELDHSVAVLFRHYRELVTPEQAAAFWSITPA